MKKMGLLVGYTFRRDLGPIDPINIDNVQKRLTN